ncbi:helix-turn-helix domain-containing protein, partial [Acidobacteriota bacterium]
MTARNQAVPVVLTRVEREQLEALAASRSLPHGLVTRARIVLMAAQGHSNLEISKTVGLSRLSVGKWRQRFVTLRVEGLHDELRPGRPRSVSDEQVAALIRQTLDKKPKNGTHWSCRTMAKETGISKDTVKRIWHAFG